jgi:hypothetical protein
METTTIACPQGFTDPSVDPATAPIWTDGTNDYLVASGPLEGYTTSDPIQAQPSRVNIIVGMNGLDALAAMGLVVKDAEDTRVDS